MPVTLSLTKLIISTHRMVISTLYVDCT